MGRVTSLKRKESADFVVGLFSEHDAQLRRFLARILRNSADAADVAQETYLRLYRLWEAAQDVKHPRALLFRVATNLAIDHLKRSRGAAIAASDGQIESLVDDVPLPETRLQAQDSMRWLGRIVDELPAQQRRVFIMHKVSEMTRAQIATELGIALSTVEQHLTRAHAHCRRRLKELGFD